MLITYGLLGATHNSAEKCLTGEFTPESLAYYSPERYPDTYMVASSQWNASLKKFEYAQLKNSC